MQSGLFSEEEVKAEANRQNQYLNSVVGIIAFTLGLSCAAMPNPQKAALFCLGILIPILFMSLRHFPPTIHAIRQLAAETKDAHVLEVKGYLEKKYLGTGAILKTNVVYLFGLFFFMLVLVSPDFTCWLIK